jgi:hypothetical protein
MRVAGRKGCYMFQGADIARSDMSRRSTVLTMNSMPLHASERREHRWVAAVEVELDLVQMLCDRSRPYTSGGGEK